MKEEFTEKQQERMFTILEKADRIKENNKNGAEQILETIGRKKWSDDQIKLVGYIAEKVKEADEKLEWMNIGKVEDIGKGLTEEEVKKEIESLIEKVPYFDAYKIENDCVLMGMRPSNMQIMKTAIKDSESF